MRGRSSGKTMAIALGAALALHGALLSVGVHSQRSPPDAAVDASGATEQALADHAAPSPGPELAAITLINQADLGELLVARPGPFDSAGTADAHPLARADADRSGLEAAHAGGEIVGGAFRETQRRDHEDQRAEIWNGDARAQVAIESPDRRDRRATRSPEAVTRQPTVGFDSTTDRAARARRREPDPRPGTSEATGERDSQGTTIPQRDWSDADPVFDTMVAARRNAGRDGRVAATAKTAVSDRGSAQADVPRRGRLVGALDAAAASDETDPKPFELAQSGSGGAGEGVAGATGPGLAARGSGEGTGSSTGKRRGRGGEAIVARQSDPYFRDLYRRLDKHVRFPRDLAKALEQGTVVARFRLNPDGRVSAIVVTKTSGFEGFDDALVAGLRRAGPFGKVPSRLLGSRQSIQIIAAYRFSNPLIR